MQSLISVSAFAWRAWIPAWSKPSWSSMGRESAALPAWPQPASTSAAATAAAAIPRRRGRGRRRGAELLSTGSSCGGRGGGGAAGGRRRRHRRPARGRVAHDDEVARLEGAAGGGDGHEALGREARRDGHG